MATDPRALLVALVGLVLTVVATVVGGIILAAGGHELPPAIIAIGSGAGGALAMAITTRNTPGPHDT